MQTMGSYDNLPYKGVSYSVELGFTFYYFMVDHKIYTPLSKVLKNRLILNCKSHLSYILLTKNFEILLLSSLPQCHCNTYFCHLVISCLLLLSVSP
jgi:hypothetical protein